MALHKILMSKDKTNDVFCAKAMLSSFSFHNNHNNQYMVGTWEKQSNNTDIITDELLIFNHSFAFVSGTQNRQPWPSINRMNAVHSVSACIDSINPRS